MGTNFENTEKLEQIEASAMEECDEIIPLEQNEEASEIPEVVEEPAAEMSSCPCMGGCGSNYNTGGCPCMSSCGSNYHKG